MRLANTTKRQNGSSLAKPDTVAGCWLQAKLDCRAGKMDDAVANMHKAWAHIEGDEKNYTAWTPAQTGTDVQLGFDYVVRPDYGFWAFGECAEGELATLHLSRGDFVQALDIFRQGKLWEDAAYVAERVLTANELKDYVDKQPVVTGTDPDSDPTNTNSLRYLLGRRFVREDRYDDAAHYLKSPYDKVLKRYVASLKNGADAKLPKGERAKALFNAAWLARYDGMELMGTEVAPDGFVFGGDFESSDIVKERISGVHHSTVFDPQAQKDVEKVTPIDPKPGKQELQRIAKSDTSPDTRFHYRTIAAALAIRAANLLADNTEELADVVNTAGNWVKNSDEKTANRYFQIIDKRCSRTKIGHAASAKHWFVGDTGPWSTEQQAAHDAMAKELGLPVPGQ